MTVWRFANRLGVTLVFATGLAVLPAAPAGAAPGFDTALTELPGRFVAGAGAETVTAVVSTTLDGDCRKVRWSMVLRADGLRLDQIGVDRIEQTGVVPLDIQDEDGGARLTDRELDPGTLCRNRTVTAQYRLSVDEAVTAGRIVIAVEAYDAQSRLLDRQSATREVVRERAGSPPERRAPAQTEPTRPGPTQPEPSPSTPEPSPSIPEPTEAAGESPVLAEGPDAGNDEPNGGSGPGLATAAGRDGTGLTEVGFAVGGLLLFLGAGLLLRLRSRTRLAMESASVPPRRRGHHPGARPGYRSTGRRG